jgi:hypothetical protein
MLTGLSRGKLHNPIDLVTEEDIQAAPEEKRDYLCGFLGKTYCSVVSEAEMGRVSAGKANFAASVPLAHLEFDIEHDTVPGYCSFTAVLCRSVKISV